MSLANLQDLKGKRILVVDDVIDNQVIEGRFLRKAGAEVDFASDGLEAVEKAMNGCHDAILMDLHMPYLDGINATARLRSKGYQKPIIAVTADSQPSTKKRAYETGFDDFISKPFSFRDLLSALRRFIGLDPTLTLVPNQT